MRFWNAPGPSAFPQAFRVRFVQVASQAGIHPTTAGYLLLAASVVRLAIDDKEADWCKGEDARGWLGLLNMDPETAVWALQRNGRLYGIGDGNGHREL